MEKLNEFSQKASKSFQAADHMVNVTHPVVKDPKVLLLAITHLNNAFENAISALIYYDYHFKRIPNFPNDFGDKLDIFRRYTCTKYNIPRETVQTILDVKSIYQDHKSSEIEFRRRNNFVIASKNYRLRTINSEKLKRFLVLAKPLLTKVFEVKKLNDRRIN
jgi:hypothetical protein